MIEFVLCGIPMLFAWISIIYLAMGMWNYATLQYAAKQTAIFLSTHGGQYVSSGPNAPKQIKDAAAVMQYWAIGIPWNQMYVTFGAGGSGTDATLSCRLDACLTNATVWPPAANNGVGNDVRVRATYTWHSPIGMLAPGPGGSGYVSFGTSTLSGYSHEFIIF